MVQEFPLGTVVVPAVNGVLAGLGHDVPSMGDRALGVVLETQSRKCRILFPELKLTVWLGKDEMVDVFEQSALGNSSYQKLIPNLEVLTEAAAAPLVWWIHRLCSMLPLTHILAIEMGASLGEVWSDNLSPVENYYRGVQGPTAYIGLGVHELILDEWHKIEKLLGSKLLFARFLPSGMHKLEIAFFLRNERL